MTEQAGVPNIRAALDAAETVARSLDLRWGEIRFTVQDARVHSIDEIRRRDRRDNDGQGRHVQLREGP